MPCSVEAATHCVDKLHFIKFRSFTEILFLEICDELSLMVGKNGLFDFMLKSIGSIGSEDNTLLVIIAFSSRSRLLLLVGETSKIKLLQN